MIFVNCMNVSETAVFSLFVRLGLMCACIAVHLPQVWVLTLESWAHAGYGAVQIGRLIYFQAKDCERRPNLALGFCLFCYSIFLLLLVNICFCCVRFSFFNTTPRDWLLGRTSPKVTSLVSSHMQCSNSVITERANVKRVVSLPSGVGGWRKVEDWWMILLASVRAPSHGDQEATDQLRFIWKMIVQPMFISVIYRVTVFTGCAWIFIKILICQWMQLVQHLVILCSMVFTCSFKSSRDTFIQNENTSWEQFLVDWSWVISRQ